MLVEFNKGYQLFLFQALKTSVLYLIQETQLYGTVIRLNEPVGVIGIVCPNDETPLLSFISLFAPAISRANSVVIVPNEEAPLPALDMYQIFDTSDLPGNKYL